MEAIKVMTILSFTQKRQLTMKIDRRRIPKHLRHLSDNKLIALIQLLRREYEARYEILKKKVPRTLKDNR